MRLPVRHDEERIDDSYELVINTYIGKSYHETPENNLTVAVMAEAISLLLKGPGEAKKDYALTVQWLNGDYESHPGWSFDEVAERLGCDSDRLRLGIKQYINEYEGKPIRNLFSRSIGFQIGEGDEA